MQTDLDGDRLGAFVPGPQVRCAPTGSGRLDGLSFAVKDLIDIEGTVTGAGNPDWAATHGPAITNAPAVAALLGAGARLIGKTVTDELAFSLEGANHHFGTPLNPRAPEHLPGGSSSGSAAAVAGHAVDFALGTDTGGSVRVPAAFCGLFGFRPTHGAISLAGVVPFAPSYDTIGVLTRDMAVMGRVAETLIGRADAGPLRRVLVAADAFELADRSTAQAIWGALPDALRDSQPIAIYGGASDDWRHAYRVLQGWEIWQSLGPWIARTSPRFGPAIAARFQDASTITQAEAERWRPWRARMRRRMAEMLGSDGVLVLPTVPTGAPRKDVTEEATGAFYAAALALTSVAGHTGLPVITLPIATADGLPVGLSVIGPAGADRALLSFVSGLADPR